jgi:hypothetical protein
VDFMSPRPGRSVKVTGTWLRRSPARRGREAVPYRDNILTMHLVDLQGEGGACCVGDQALVYGWGMRDNRLTGFADLRPGDTVSLPDRAWEAVEGEYGSYRRTPLDDEMLELEITKLGETANR